MTTSVLSVPFFSLFLSLSFSLIVVGVCGSTVCVWEGKISIERRKHLQYTTVACTVSSDDHPVLKYDISCQSCRGILTPAWLGHWPVADAASNVRNFLTTKNRARRDSTVPSNALGDTNDSARPALSPTDWSVHARRAKRIGDGATDETNEKATKRVAPVVLSLPYTTTKLPCPPPLVYTSLLSSSSLVSLIRPTSLLEHYLYIYSLSFAFFFAKQSLLFVSLLLVRSYRFID